MFCREKNTTFQRRNLMLAYIVSYNGIDWKTTRSIIAKLHFFFSGKPPPKVTWLINDQPVQNLSNIGISSTTLVPNNSRVVRSDLRITNLSRKDVHSEITCQATNNDKIPPHAATLHVDMNCKYMFTKYTRFANKLLLQIKPSCTI